MAYLDKFEYTVEWLCKAGTIDSLHFYQVDYLVGLFNDVKVVMKDDSGQVECYQQFEDNDGNMREVVYSPTAYPTVIADIIRKTGRCISVHTNKTENGNNFIGYYSCDDRYFDYSPVVSMGLALCKAYIGQYMAEYHGEHSDELFQDAKLSKNQFKMWID